MVTGLSRYRTLLIHLAAASLAGLVLHVYCGNQAFRPTSTVQLERVHLAQQRWPQPDDAQVAKAKQKLADVFSDDFKQASELKGALRLAQLKKLSSAVAELTRSEEDPPTLFATFTVAIDIGILSGDIEHVAGLLRSLEQRFDIDPLAWRQRTFRSMITQVPTLEPNAKEQRRAYVKLGEQLIRYADVDRKSARYAAAHQLYELVQHCFHAAEDKREQQYGRLAAELGERAARQQAILEMIEQLPKSSVAGRLNLEIGSYYCFEVGDWKRGLAYLKDSDEPKLAAAARQDMLAAEANWEAAGDRWWEALESVTEQQHLAAIRTRAVTYYLQALKKAKGLSKARLSKRIQEAGPSAQLAARDALRRPPSACVELGLRWLREYQRPYGGWNLSGPYSDGGEKESRAAATAMATLAMLSAGSSPDDGQDQERLKQSLDYLLLMQSRDGLFSMGDPNQHVMYSNALASLAMLRAYTSSKDGKYKAPVARAVEFAEWSQGKAGGWRYEPRADSDTSVTVWYVTFLTEAQAAGFDVDEVVLHRANAYLDLVSHDSNSRYSYLKGQAPNAGVTAAALKCRLGLGWSEEHPALMRGIQVDLMQNLPKTTTQTHDVYYWFNATEVLKATGGEPWERWRGALKETAERLQEKDGPNRGSWSPKLDLHGKLGGRLYITCFLILALQSAT